MKKMGFTNMSVSLELPRSENFVGILVIHLPGLNASQTLTEPEGAEIFTRNMVSFLWTRTGPSDRNGSNWYLKG